MLQSSSTHRSLAQRLAAALVGSAPSLADFPNRLANPLPERRELPRIGVCLFLLVLITLIPRVLMALRLAVICSDGTYYVALAEAIERGDIQYALNMQFNCFPVILAALHQLGLPYEVAAKLWGVTMSTLVVLPLFGWIRRQFDERVATVGCLLYAVHPEMIEWSPEVVREPTFWFLFTLTLYLLWRAIAEVRWLWFLSAGLALTTSALTRFEGLFLFLPLVLWAGMRWWALQSQRGKLLLGTLACPLALPGLLLLVNLSWLQHDNPASLLRLEPWRRVERWVQSFRQPAPTPTKVTPAESITAEPTPLSQFPLRKRPPTLAWTFVHTLERGLTPFYGLLVLGGSAVWWRLFLRRDQVPPLLVGLMVMAGIWIHLWFTQQTSGRYVMTIVLLSARGAALGLISAAHALRLSYLALVARSEYWLRFRFLRTVTQPWVVVATTCFSLGILGWIDALSTRYQSREMSAELGDWIRLRYGDRRGLFGADEQLAIVSYYAHAYYWEPPPGVTGQALIEFVAGNPPELILVAQGAKRARDFSQLIASSPLHGYARVEPALLPDPGDRVVLLERVPRNR